jgi:hypothetical protein
MWMGRLDQASVRMTTAPPNVVRELTSFCDRPLQADLINTKVHPVWGTQGELLCAEV